jgi:hypothetical protein
MDFAGLSDERVTRYPQYVAGLRPSGAADRAGRRSRPHAARVEPPAAAPGTADERQAEYLLGLLMQNRRQIEQRIDKHRKSIVRSETEGDFEGAAGLRQLIRIEEKDRHTVDEMIENLQRRFRVRAPSEVSATPRRARLVGQ